MDVFPDGDQSPVDYFSNSDSAPAPELSSGDGIGSPDAHGGPDQRLLDQLQRNARYREQQQEGPIALLAALRGITVDFMDHHAHLAHGFRLAVADTPMTLDNLDDFVPGINLDLRLGKLIAQMAQVEIRSSRPDSSAKK